MQLAHRQRVARGRAEATRKAKGEAKIDVAARRITRLVRRAAARRRRMRLRAQRQELLDESAMLRLQAWARRRAAQKKVTRLRKEQAGLVIAHEEALHAEVRSSLNETAFWYSQFQKNELWRVASGYREPGGATVQPISNRPKPY